MSEPAHAPARSTRPEADSALPALKEAHRPVATRTRDLVNAALLAALLSASAWIAIPLGGGVPITLQVFIVLLAGLVLPPRAAGASIGVYLLLGAASVPVFAGGTAGLGVLFGPTGGYLFGFLFAAVAVSLIRTRLGAGAARVIGVPSRQRFVDVLAVAIGVLLIYLLGWTQLMFVTGLGPHAAFLAGVAPFIALDAVKAAVALGVAEALRRSRVVP